LSSALGTNLNNLANMSAAHGYCEPALQKVRDLLEQNILSEEELGTFLYVDINGQDAINLWGGYADRARSKPWNIRRYNLDCMVHLEMHHQSCLIEGFLTHPPAYLSTGPSSLPTAKSLSRSGMF
jgi:hypothetical protein